MKKVLINGLSSGEVEILLRFMESKLDDNNYINSIEFGGNDCDMDWMEDGMNISGEDMVHELFDLYALEGQEDGVIYYTLLIGEYKVTTEKDYDEWSDTYAYEL